MTASRSRFGLKEVVLVLLVVQSTSIVLLMRYSKTRPRSEDLGPTYLDTATILMAEVLKLPVCLFMAAHTLGGVGPLRELLRTELFGTGKWDRHRRWPSPYKATYSSWRWPTSRRQHSR